MKKILLIALLLGWNNLMAQVITTHVTQTGLDAQLLPKGNLTSANTWTGNNIWTQIGTFQRTTTSAQQVLNLETIGTTGRPFVNFRANSTDYGYLGYGATGSDEMYLYNYRNEKLIFGTNSASRLTIQGNGNIGIGTLVDAGYKLDVSGTSIFRNTLNTTNDIIVNSINIGRGSGNLIGNLIIGSSNFGANTTGVLNVVIGEAALANNTTGGSNVVIGRASLFNNILGGGNIGLGVNSGRFIANGSTANTQSDNSVFIGNNAYPNAINESNQIVIGNSAIGLGNNTTVLGNSSTVTTRLFGNLGLNTSSPTHTLTLGQGNTGYADYNTVDQTVNYERVRKYWSGNTYIINAENGGTGSARPISIIGNSRTLTIGGSNGFFDFLTTTGTAPIGLILTGTSAHSSGSISHILNAPTISQTGTAGYTANKTSVYEQALGSGSKLLLDLGTNTASNGSGTHTSKFNVDNGGSAIFSNPTGNILNTLNGGGSQSTGLIFQQAGTEVGRIGFQATTDLRFATGNNLTRLTITSGGNTLIGTTTDAGYKLDVSGTTRVQGNLIIGNSTNSPYRLYINGNKSLATDLEGLYIDNGQGWRASLLTSSANTALNSIDSQPISFQLNSVEKMRLNSSGNLLIGTTTDNTVDRLQVTGSGLFTAVGNTLTALSGGSTSNGRISIGRTSIDGQFYVAGATNAGAVGSTAGDVIFKTFGTKLLFDTNGGAGTPSMVINSGNGNVGIGIVSPNTLLEVTGTIGTNGLIAGNGIRTSRLGTPSQFIQMDIADASTSQIYASSNSKGLRFVNNSGNASLNTATDGITFYVPSTVANTVNAVPALSLTSGVSPLMGINNGTPTHTLTLGQGNTGYVDYNTVDQTVNYERVRKYWSGNTYNISSEAGGTGVQRDILISNSGTILITQNPTASIPAFINFSRGTGGIYPTIGVNSMFSGASTNQTAFLLSPTINQTGTSGYIVSKTSVYEQALGSGSKLLLDLGTNSASNGSGTHTTKFNVDNTGTLTLANNIAVANNIFLNSNTSQFQQSSGFVMSSATNPIFRPYNATSYDFALNNSTSVIRINQSGNVGIGTTTDAGYKLDVVGNIRVTGTALLQNDLAVNSGGGTNYITLRDGTISKTLGTGFTFSSSLNAQGLTFTGVAGNNKITIPTGTNSIIGTTTLVGGTITVANTSVGANSQIFVTVSSPSGTQGFLSVSKVAGTSFTVNSTSGTETSIVNWWIIN